MLLERISSAVARFDPSLNQRHRYVPARLMVLMMAITRRRSLAAATLAAIMRTRFVNRHFHHVDVLSPSITRFASSSVWLCIAVIASESCCSTMPPMVMTESEIFFQLCVELAGNVFIKIEIVKGS